MRYKICLLQAIEGQMVCLKIKNPRHLIGKPYKESRRTFLGFHKTTNTTLVPSFVQIGEGHVKKLLKWHGMTLMPHVNLEQDSTSLLSGKQTWVKYIVKVFNYKYKNLEKTQIQILLVHMSQMSYFCDADATWC